MPRNPPQRSTRSTPSKASGAKSSMEARARRVSKTGQRGNQAVIATAARNLRKVRIRYTKVTTGETVERILEPYSFRYGKSSLGRGRWKYLYGYHGRHRKIEKYLVANILAAKLTRYKYEPRWTVEIG